MSTITRFAPTFSLDIPLVHQGKTRETYALSQIGSSMNRAPYEDVLLVVTSDRLSTHDVVHRSKVPHKGKVLTALTVFWLRNHLKENKIRHHLRAAGSEIYDYVAEPCGVDKLSFQHRSLVVKKLDMIPVEFIFRGRLGGSLHKKFYSKGLANPYGVPLESGLPLMHEFEKPIFTPTDKSETDDPLSARATEARYPRAVEVSYRVFLLVREHLRKFGIEMVDSKFEVGLDSRGSVTLADEIATPDSSRFCVQSKIVLGSDPPWLDKQIARDEAERIWGPGPKVPLEFSPKIIAKLTQTYQEVFELITGQTLSAFQREFLD